MRATVVPSGDRASRPARLAGLLPTWGSVRMLGWACVAATLFAAGAPAAEGQPRDSSAPSPATAASPRLTTRAAAETQDSRFAAVDRYVDAAPSSARRSVSDLASYLAGAGRSDLEKTRAIFRWLTMNIAYDMDGLRSGNPGDLGPEAVLARGRSVCSGYAGLARALGEALGLEIVVVNGWSKGYGYTAGESFQGRTNHAWNAVRIDGEWRLMDPTWGAGHVEGNQRWVRDFQEFYFLTDPTEFIFDHLPEDPSWQLLNPPLSRDDFAELVYLRPDFFSNGLSVVSHRESRIRARDRLTIVLRAPENVGVLARLLQASNERPLPDTRTFVQLGGGEARIDVAFSDAGDYIVRLFAKPQSAEGPYGWALDYRVRADGGARDADFPMAYSSFRESGSVLYAPMSGRLAAGEDYEFRVRVPGATQVSVICGGEWSGLTANGDLYVGIVNACRGEVGLYAKFPGSDSFTGLLMYEGR